MVISLIFLIVNISWKKERERELWPERSSMVREQWPWHHQLLLLLFPSSSSSRYVFFIYFVPIQSNTNEIHSRWACLSETSCHSTCRYPKTSPILFLWSSRLEERYETFDQPQSWFSRCPSTSTDWLCLNISPPRIIFMRFFWWWWFTKWRHFRVDIFCEKKEKWKLMPTSEFLVVFVGTFITADIFTSCECRGFFLIFFRANRLKKKKENCFFLFQKCRLFIHRCVCV